ncbi:MAG: DUF6390 family protein [Candidatus Berkelbacteria bacterium]|nr:DUF6390 family protein [Candidatus Berkelbacteria bacterium]
MEKVITRNLAGLTLCARYAFMPNKLKYCGPSNERTLFDYAASGLVDKGLVEMLEKFETMHPYLKLIAKANKIKDPFDKRVVEAYWLGNSLLNKVEMNSLYLSLLDDHHLKKRLNTKIFNELIFKIPIGAKPHHAFHVFNIFIRTGKDKIKHTLSTMQSCIITVGRVKRVSNTDELTVEADSLDFQKGKIVITSRERKVRYNFFNQKLIDDIKIGDFVSLHWDFTCDKLNLSQTKKLRVWNQYHLNLANLTI